MLLLLRRMPVNLINLLQIILNTLLGLCLPERVSSNSLAKIVKLNDLTDNMDIRRLVEIKDNDVARMRKYLKAYRQLL